MFSLEFKGWTFASSVMYLRWQQGIDGSCVKWKLECDIFSMQMGRGLRGSCLPVFVDLFLSVSLALLTFTFVCMGASKLPEVGLTKFGF
jgi:hypothetical protein